MAESSAKHCQREFFRVSVLARIAVCSADTFRMLGQEALTPDAPDEDCVCKRDERPRHLFLFRYALSSQRSSVA